MALLLLLLLLLLLMLYRRCMCPATLASSFARRSRSCPSLALQGRTAAPEDMSLSSTAATEHGNETQLAELLNQEAGQTGEYELKVLHSDILDYKYTYAGKEVTTQKLQVLLQSRIPEQYCLGVAKLQKQDKKELQQMHLRFAVGSTWKFASVKLLDEKTAYVHTACRVVFDLRKTKATAMLQSTSIPKAPSPPTTIADVLQLKQMQRFDLMAIPAAILDTRRSGAGMHIADVRLIDGSVDPRNAAPERVNAALPLTLFFKNAETFESFKQHVGRSPVLFMCLSGYIDKNDSQVKITTLKDMSWWEPASGAKCDTMRAQADALCDSTALLLLTRDVALLKKFDPQDSADYVTVPATLSACSVLDQKRQRSALPEDATEHLYQLNHVYVPPPGKADSILYTGSDDQSRLFTLLDVWDYSKKITLAFRSRAMLQLAQMPEEGVEEYKEAHKNGELRHPLLASLRVRIKKRDDAQVTNATEHDQKNNNNLISATVVEAEPCEPAEVPNDSVDAIHGLLAAAPELSADRLAAVPLRGMNPSPFYNMLANDEPFDKALVLLKFTKRSNGKQIANGFRMVTDGVQDACDPSEDSKYVTIACCTVEKAPDFTVAINSLALAVICKVASPSKPEHIADLYIEMMETVASDRQKETIEMIKQLQRVSTVNRGNATVSAEAAWQQRKCRRLQRYPTQQ